MDKIMNITSVDFESVYGGQQTTLILLMLSVVEFIASYSNGKKTATINKWIEQARAIAFYACMRIYEVVDPSVSF